MDKKKLKFIRRRLGWHAIRVFLALNRILPLSLSYLMGRILGNVAYRIISRHRRIGLDNLSIAFPDKPLKERKRIIRNFFIFMAQSSFELLHILENTQKLENIRIEGEQHLREALKKKKGVMLLTAHIGNFPLMNLKLAKAGYPINIVIRPMRDKLASDYFYKLRERGGVKTIFSLPRRECIRGIIGALRNNEVVVMLMDQNFGTGGVWVKFFGKLAATPVGPIVLALRTKAAIVPVFVHKESDAQHCIKVFPESNLIVTEDRDETVLLNAIKFTGMIEGWIREFIPQWGWIHRRWKSRPSEEIKKEKFKVEG